jgi:phosphatidylinositol-4,5-bisphosphate 3-kinase
VLEEIHDETQRIVDIQPFFALFKLERKHDNESPDLKQDISILIGKKLDDFKTLKNPEVNDFRSRISKFSQRISKERAKMKPKERILYQNRPTFAESDGIPTNVVPLLGKKEDFVVAVNLPADENVSTMTMEVTCSMRADELLEKIIAKMTMKYNASHFNVDELVLKFCGQEEYILGDFPIIKFTCVQESLLRNETPSFVVMKVSDVRTSDEYCSLLTRKPSSRMFLKSKSSIKVSSWELQENFKVTVQAINNLRVDNNKTLELGVRAGLFHGGRSLCESRDSETIFVRGSIESSLSAEWNQTLQFDIRICDIPRMARLCFVVYQVEKNSSQCIYKGCKTPLFWVNTTIFDFKNQLKTDGQTLYTWFYVEYSDTDEILLPLGTVEQNPRIQECASVTIMFPNHIARTKFFYPCESEIRSQARIKQVQKQLQHMSIDPRFITKTCEPFMHNDRIFFITQQERKAIWNMRYNCMNLLPNFLPYLLCCVEWNCRENVSEVVNILKQWPRSEMSVEQVLKLLDYTYADKCVRKFAINFLHEVKDEVLQIYLLQLIQALKHELYLHCDLVELLLERASRNQRIGQYLFWYLRSEINVPSVEIRFSLILEAYLKTSQEHIAVLMKQHCW